MKNILLTSVIFFPIYHYLLLNIHHVVSTYYYYQGMTKRVQKNDPTYDNKNLGFPHIFNEAEIQKFNSPSSLDEISLEIKVTEIRF